VAVTATYRKRFAEVQAIEWAGTQDSAEEIIGLVGARFHMVDPEDRGDDPDGTGMVLTSRHSTWVPIRTGEWVVKTADGGLEVWDAADFAFQFERVDGGR
jgi:hypothetical protein